MRPASIPPTLRDMKKILTSALVVGAIAGVVNFLLAYLLGGSILETPYQPETTEPIPAGEFAVASGIFTLLLTLVGAVILGVLVKRLPERALRIWLIISVVFLALYGIFPFAAPVASFKAGLLTNLLHAVAGFAALYFIPRRAGLV